MHALRLNDSASWDMRNLEHDTRCCGMALYRAGSGSGTMSKLVSFYDRAALVSKTN